MDRRLLRSNGRVADLSLTGRIEAERFVSPVQHMVREPVTAILVHPSRSGPRDRELAFGEGFAVLETVEGFAFGHALRDGYVGHVEAAHLAPAFLPATHRVIAQSYWRSAPALKDPHPPTPMPLGARVAVCATHRDHCDWAEIDWPAADPESTGGAVYMPLPHLAPLDPPATDPVTEAARYLGLPYLWAGNSGFGIDCSGLVQAACLACGIPCPGDSDLQQAALGETLPQGTAPRRGDLLFWKGHVAWVSDPDTILHANAHAMAVTHEPLRAAIDRIAAQGGGPVTRHARLT